jgi:hypothetical protein
VLQGHLIAHVLEAEREEHLLLERLAELVNATIADATALRVGLPHGRAASKYSRAFT